MAITYLCPAEKKPSGGVKVIYRHSEILNEHGIESYVYHPKYSQFQCDWFPHNVRFRRIDPGVRNFFLRNKGIKLLEKYGYKQDFIIIPEIWAARYGQQCLDLGFDYAIFVQNGYFIYDGKENFSEDELQRVYENAKIILSISEDTSDVISMSFPTITRDKIIRLTPNIGKFYADANKEKIISYMPRKLSSHADKVCFYLTKYLPAHWRLVPIENKNEHDVASILAKSSIFMSFCDQEGCPLPPLEAAFSKNIVVGYTGQGAKEYFCEPIFRKVNNGDFIHFINAVRVAIDDVELGAIYSDCYMSSFEKLKKTYSNESEKKYLLLFASMIK